MRVIFWNVKSFNNFESISERILGSDIICLAETWMIKTRTFLSNNKKDFKVIPIKALKSPGRGRPSGGMLIAYNVKKYLELDRQMNDNCLVVRLKAEKVEFIICCCYVREKDDIPEFFTNLDALLEKVKKRSQLEITIFLCGDFNSSVANLNSLDSSLVLPNGLSIRNTLDKTANKRGRKLCEELEQRSFLILIGRVQGDIPGNFTFIDKKGQSTIDLFRPNPMDMKYIKKLKTMEIVSNSDHDAVSLILNIKVTEGSPTKDEKKLRWKNHKKEDYIEQLLLKNPPNTDLNVDLLNQKLTNDIYKAAEKADMYRTNRDRGERGKLWYDEECWKKKVEVRRLRRRWKKEKNNKNLLTDLLNCKENYKKMIKVKKENVDLKRVVAIRNAKSGRAFWSSLLFRKKRKALLNKVLIDKWQDFLANSSKQKEFSEKKSIQSIVDTLDNEITIAEIKESINSTKNNKAAGIDEISYEFLKALPENYLEFSKKFFNKIYNERQTPEIWSKIITTMIYKKGDAECPTNYRPIALVNCLTKFFISFLKKRLEGWMGRERFLREEQAGFRNGRGCRDNIFILDYLIESALREKRGKLFAFFIDFITAFPSLNYKKMWEKMESIGLSDKFINTCKSFYNFASTAIRTDEGMTDFFDIRCIAR